MKQYSLYEAKAKLSEVIKVVLKAGGVTITQRGIPVVQIFPYRSQKLDLESRLTELTKSEKLSPASQSWKHYKNDLPKNPVKPGAVDRFLIERE